MKIIAFDQASVLSGYVVYDYDKDLDYTTIDEFGVFDLKKSKEPFERVILLATEVKTLIERCRPEMVVVEEIYLGMNPDGFKKLAQVQVSVRLIAYWNGVPSKVISPSTARSKYKLKGKDETAEYMTELFPKLAEEKRDVTDAALLGWYWIQENKTR